MSRITFLDHQVEVRTADAEIARNLFSAFEYLMLDEVVTPTTREVLEVVDLGSSHQIARGDGTIVGPADPLEIRRLLRHEIVRAFVRARRSLFWLHAGAAATAEGAVLCVAPSGRGKSTIVAELCARGWHYGSDDVSPIDPETLEVLPFPLTPAVRVSGDADLPPQGVARLPKIRLPVASDLLMRGPATIRAIVFPRYRAGAAGTLTAHASPAEAALEVARQGIDLDAPKKADSVRLAAGLIDVRPAYVLEFSEAEEAATLLERELSRRATTRRTPAV